MFNRKKYDKEYRLKNKEKIKVKRKEYYLNNVDKIREYYLNNKENILSKTKERRLNNKEAYKIFSKKYYLKNIDKHKEYYKKYYLNNKKDIASKSKEYRLKNILKIRAYRRVHEPLKRKADLNYRIKHILRVHLGTTLRKHNSMKKGSVLKFLGQPINEFKKHLEQQFKDGMSWDNWGAYKDDGRTTWHIDHIIPCSKFDLTKEEDQKKCFHFTNLQPLWAIDNIKKGDRI